jgi:hypothetical protein
MSAAAAAIWEKSSGKEELLVFTISTIEYQLGDPRQGHSVPFTL